MLWIAAVAGLVGFLTLIPLTIHSDENKGVAFLPSPLDVLTNNSTKEQIKEAIKFASEKYGGNYYQLYKTIECESSFDTKAIGDSGKAFGLGQYHKPTFERFCKGDYYSAKDQLICMSKMFKDGLTGHWTCWKNLFK